jgi:hypothetical protein
LKNSIKKKSNLSTDFRKAMIGRICRTNIAEVPGIGEVPEISTGVELHLW